MTTGLLTIRRYQPADHKQVIDLHYLALDAVGANAGNGPWDDDLLDIQRNYLDTNGEFLVGEIAGHIVAMGALKRRSATEAEIKRMRVHPDYQRRGFGSAMLHLLEQRAIEFGYERLYLNTTASQVTAQGLYLSKGYKETGRLTVHDTIILCFTKILRPKDAERRP